MLFSESKERENQFIISLKIGFPFVLLAFVLFYLFKISDNTLENLFLTIVLIPIYIYYIFYLVYNGFKSTLIESITKTFTRNEILEKIDALKKEKSIVLVRVENIADINERYGINIADSLLRIFCQKLDEFLKNYKFKEIPIGRYGGGNFILILDSKEKELRHLLTIFSKELKNIGISDIEVKVDFAIISSQYDRNVINIVKKLLFIVDEHKEIEKVSLNIKPDEYEKVILESIDHEKFIFKYQPAVNNKNSIKILEVLTKIYSKEYGMLSYNQIERVVNHTGYEMKFYKTMFTVLIKELKNRDFNDIFFSVKISAVTLRNNEFRMFLNQLFYKNKIDPKLFILEFSEDKIYKEFKRFDEIITQYQKSGFKIAMDNFAGNNSSIQYLKYLHVDLVKFDIEFTKYINDEKYTKLFFSYIQMLKELNIKVMIKFVDKESLHERIKSYNPDFIQGFIVSKPKNLKQIEEMI